jgi:hypothetical protein
LYAQVAYCSGYNVTRNDGRGHVILAVTRAVSYDRGERSSWSGTIEYDANAFVPTAVAFNGSASVRLRLKSDTFRS